MARVVIVGGGFAGLAALARLGSARDVETTLIDSRPTSQFIPMLPDLIGRDVRPESIQYPLGRAIERCGGTLLLDTVTRVDLERRTVTTEKTELPFDKLLLATGSKTNFFGQDPLEQSALKLDTVEDGLAMRRAIEEKPRSAYVVSGAGYTGVEVATHTWRRLRRLNRTARIILVDLQDRIVPMMDDRVRDCVRRELDRLGIEIRLGTTVTGYDAGTVRFKEGEPIADALLFWTAGVHTHDHVQALPVEKTKNGRLIVDDKLRFADGCFAAGDTAAVMKGEQPLRMSIQFAIAGGDTAAENILSELRGWPLRRFDPIDPGFLVPMASNRACGNVLGAHLSGGAAEFFHYFMCFYRSMGLHNRFAILRDLMTG